MHRNLVVAAAVLCAACDPGPATPVERRAPDGDLPTPARETTQSKAIEIARVEWPARESVDRTTVAELAPEARAQIDRSSVPVLLPRAPGLARSAKLVVKPAFFAASMPGQGEHAGLTVSVSATRVAHRYADIAPAEGPARVRGKKAFVTQNELIWSAAWQEHGVSYVVEIECARPSDDARCKDDAFVLSLAEDLVFVGGSFDAGGSR